MAKLTEITWRAIEPYFRQNGSYSFKADRYKNDILATEALVEDLGIPLNIYLQGVFFPTWSEQITGRKLRPRHMHTQYGLNKFKDWVILGNKKSPINMEIEFIKRTKLHIKALNMSKDEYLSGGLLIAPVLEDIRKRKVSLAYCGCQPEFKAMYKKLSVDIKEEYFYGVDVNNISIQARLNPLLTKAVS